MSNILIICDIEPAPISNEIKKLRAVMLAEKLVDRGHAITFLRTDFDHDRKRKYLVFNNEKVINGVKYIFLKCFKYKKNISIARIIHYKIFGFKVARYLKKYGSSYDCIISSYPTIESSYAAVQYCKKNNIPIVVDVRDKWPDIYSDYFDGFVSRVVSFLCSFLRRKKTYIFSYANKLTSMSHFMLNWAIDGGLRKQVDGSVFFLGSSLDELDTKQQKANSIMRNPSSGLVCSYVGGIIGSYDLGIVLKASRGHKGNVIMNIIGDGPLLSHLKSQAKGDNVNFYGWVPVEGVVHILDISDVLIFPVAYNVSPNMPNKLFDYLWAAKPILACVHGEAADLIRDNELGYVFKHGDVSDFIKGLDYLSDPKVRSKISANIKRIYDKKFSARKIYNDFACHIESIIS